MIRDGQAKTTNAATRAQPAPPVYALPAFCARIRVGRLRSPWFSGVVARGAKTPARAERARRRQSSSDRPGTDRPRGHALCRPLRSLSRRSPRGAARLAESPRGRLLPGTSSRRVGPYLASSRLMASLGDQAGRPGRRGFTPQQHAGLLGRALGCGDSCRPGVHQEPVAARDPAAAGADDSAGRVGLAKSTGSAPVPSAGCHVLHLPMLPQSGSPS